MEGFIIFYVFSAHDAYQTGKTKVGAADDALFKPLWGFLLIACVGAVF